MYTRWHTFAMAADDFISIHYYDLPSDRKCEPIDWDLVADVPPPFEPHWPAVTSVAFRTNIFAIIYLILSTLWIITSLMLIGKW